MKVRAATKRNALAGRGPWSLAMSAPGYTELAVARHDCLSYPSALLPRKQDPSSIRA